MESIKWVNDKKEKNDYAIIGNYKAVVEKDTQWQKRVGSKKGINLWVNWYVLIYNGYGGYDMVDGGSYYGVSAEETKQDMEEKLQLLNK